jgi:CRISPR/Cas system-associated protein Cas5 (RAMP superfamily)
MRDRARWTSETNKTGVDSIWIKVFKRKSCSQSSLVTEDKERTSTIRARFGFKDEAEVVKSARDGNLETARDDEWDRLSKNAEVLRKCDKIIRIGNGGAGIPRESVQEGTRTWREIRRVLVEIRFIKYGEGGTTDTVCFRVLINERLDGATTAEENALDNIVSSELTVMVLRAKSVYVTTKCTKTGQVGFHSGGLVRQNRMNRKKEIESIFPVLWSKTGAE